MTYPVSDLPVSADSLGIAVQELVAQAKKLGLTWDLRPATVVNGANTSNISATYDGDTTPLNMTSLVGILSNNSRVQVIFVPPAGHFIIGWVGTPLSFTATSLTVNGLLTLSPIPSTSSHHIQFNEGYRLWVDNAGPGPAASRMWFDGPTGGACYIGPRSGLFSNIHLRTDATTATAANCFIDTSTYQIRRSTSSARFKTNIQDADIDAEKILQLRPVRFQDKEEFTKQGVDASWHVGFIAEEVDELGLTEFVQYKRDEDDKSLVPDGIQYDRFVPALLSIIKDLKEEISDLRSRVLDLETSQE